MVDRNAHLLELIERVANLVRHEQRRLLSDLHPVQIQALAFLAVANRFSNTPIAVSEYLGVGKGTTSQTLASLRAKGLVVSAPDPDDRRVTHLTPTDAGRGALQRLATEGAWQQVCDRLPEGDVERLCTLLATVLSGLQQSHNRRTFGVCRTCRYLLREGETGFRCGLTALALVPEETERICREHEMPPATPG